MSAATLGPLLRAMLAWLFIAGTLAVPVSAQTGQIVAVPSVEIGPYFGIARHSLAGTTLGLIPDRNHIFAGLHLTMNLVRKARWAFGYAPEIVPLLIVSNNPRYRTIRLPSGTSYEFEDGRGPVTGVALSPIGLEGQVRVGRWRPYLAGAGGVVWFTRAVPDIEARAFNYTFELGGGVRWQVGHRDAVRIGFKFHHLSNANSARSNPGIDAAVFLIGVEHGAGASR